MRVGSLFSGIGGLDLGLERAGMSIAWHCEVEPFRRAVLSRRWPDTPCYEDVRAIHAFDRCSVRAEYRSSICCPNCLALDIDLLCGGFPCEDISRAGRRAGIDGAKSGLWSDFARLIGELRPRYVLVENSTSLTVQGIEVVLSDLHESGYDAEWDCLPAFALGAPHIRDRLYLLAYSRERRHRAPEETVFAGWTSSQLHGGWTPEPCLGRVADGIPNRVDRLQALGAAVVPQVAEWIGRRIMSAEGAA